MTLCPGVYHKYNKSSPSRLSAGKSLIGDSHDGQIDVCRLVAMVIWSWKSNVVNRGQTCLWGRPRQTRLGHVHVHGYRRGTFLLYWNDERIVVLLKRVGIFSFDFVQSDSFLCRPTDEHNRETFAWKKPYRRFTRRADFRRPRARPR